MIAARLTCLPFEPLFTEDQWDSVVARLELSRREQQIVRLVFHDMREQSIAVELGVSVNTVHTELRRLYLKLGVRSRVQLVLTVVSEHLARSREAERTEPTLRLYHGARKAA
jgi:DNA-binding NarL/FixJ family response regulator